MNINLVDKTCALSKRDKLSLDSSNFRKTDLGLQSPFRAWCTSRHPTPTDFCHHILPFTLYYHNNDILLCVGSKRSLIKSQYPCQYSDFPLQEKIKKCPFIVTKMGRWSFLSKEDQFSLLYMLKMYYLSMMCRETSSSHISLSVSWQWSSLSSFKISA